jgi:hypothetical protein
MNARTLRRRARRRSIVAISAACGLAASAPGHVAAANPRGSQLPEPNSAAVDGRQPGGINELAEWTAPATDKTAATALAERYGLAVHQAADQLEISAYGEELAAWIASSYPDQFAGSWIDYGEKPQLTVAVTDGGLAEQIAAATRATQYPVQVVQRSHTVSQLDSAMGAVASALGIGERPDEVAAPPKSLIVEVAGRDGAILVRTDGTARQIELVTESLAKVDTSGVPVVYDNSGDNVDVADDVCYVSYCPPSEGPWRGTLQVRADANGDGQADAGYCSAGFNAKRTISGSTQWLATTAGHCTAGFNVNWKHSTGQDLLIGPEAGAQSWNNVDGMIIRINDPAGYWRPQNTVWRPSNHNYPITQKISTPGSSLWGNWICHAGGAQGGYEACGTLVTHNAAFNGRTGLGSVAAPACPGDSGGPWFNASTNRAYGLHSGSSNADQCPGPSSEASYFTWVSNFEAAFGGTILTGPVTW